MFLNEQNLAETMLFVLFSLVQSICYKLNNIEGLNVYTIEQGKWNSLNKMFILFLNIGICEQEKKYNNYSNYLALSI